jgi:excisionase family DNA binding protein
MAAEILTAAEVAEILRVEETTVGDWARQGRIPSFKLGRLRRYSRTAIRLYVAQIATDSDG